MARSITKANPRTIQSGPLAGQTFTSERQYRNALAKLQGFTSLSAQRRAGNMISGANIASFSSVEKDEYGYSLGVISRMRRNDETLDQAAIAERVDPSLVRRYAGRYLVNRDGDTHATPNDRLTRPMVMLTPVGQIDIVVTDSRSASRLGGYWNAVLTYRDTGNDTLLNQFKGKGITSNGIYYPFITNTDAIDQLALAGGLDISEIYTLSR